MAGERGEPASRDHSGEQALPNSIRPPLRSGERRSKSRTFRVRGGMDEWLRREAAETGRSVSEVIEMLLEMARLRRDHLVEMWGGDVFDLAGRLALTLLHVERFTGENWLEDERTFRLFQQAVPHVVQNYRDEAIRARREEESGHEGSEGKTDQELAKTFAALSSVTPPAPRVERVRMTAEQRTPVAKPLGRGRESTAGSEEEDRSS